MTRFIVIAGGGTGGHIFPGLAIARELVRREASREILFVGTERGLETRLVPAAGFPLLALRLGGLAGLSIRERALSSERAAVAVGRCIRLFTRRRPAAVVGVGGFASGPAVLAALFLRVPTLIQEQNVAAGITNRWLGRWVNEIALSFPGSEAQFGGRGTVTGNPVRPEFFRISTYQGMRGRLHLLIFGGSRGARTLNSAAIAALPLLKELADRVTIVHQTGEAQYAATEAAYRESGLQATVLPFLDDMPARLEAADLIVCRAGAGTIFELAAAGRASVLVPFPFAAGRHQERNAAWMAAAGASEVVPDAQLTGDTLVSLIRGALAAPERLVARAAAARTLARPKAAADLAAMVERLMEARRR